jgi:signal transduction histidine kinase
LGYVELGSSLNVSGESLAAIRPAFLIAALGASLLAILVGLLVSHGLTAPLQSLSLAAAQMSAGNLSARAPLRSRDELGDLARRFNQMAEKLEASFTEVAAERDTLRRFIADASHELRTPITALRTFNELLQGPAAHDLEAQAEFLQGSQEQINRLAWITHNLLDLSRFDAGLARLELAQHNLGDLLTAAVLPFRALAQEQKITFTVTQPIAPVQITCDRARLEMALGNLLDNALKFTPAGGTVEMGVESLPEETRIWVADTGSGIDPVDLPHIFERFHRSLRATAPGSGLGLAIVQSIVGAHGGHVDVTSRVGEGSRFVISLPSKAGFRSLRGFGSLTQSLLSAAE